MKRLFCYLTTCITILFMSYSCTDDASVDSPEGEKPPTEKPKIDFSDMKSGEKIPIFYSEDNGKSYTGEYKAVRIGEYLWMDKNFEAIDENKITQHQINKGLDIYEIDTTSYSITVQEFKKYFGDYLSRDKLERMSSAGNMYESNYKVNSGKWNLPSSADFRQLFAMCGNGSEGAVRRTLSYKVGEISIMKKTKNAFWIDDNNTNKYGFNLVYTGGRCHNDDFPWWICYGVNDCTSHLGKKGDLYTFYAAVMYPTLDAKTAKIHDYPDTRDGKIWAWLPVRWCRKLTDEELGYKLYVNKDRTDIIKLDLDKKAPSGYEILPKGYLRGFYVQYILENPNPTKTVSELRNMELNLPEVKYGTKPT